MIRYNQISLKLLGLLLAGLLVGGAVWHNTTTNRPLAFVQKFKPEVGVENAGQYNNIQKRGKPLFNGDTLRTNENGFALVQFMDKSLAKVKPESRLIVEGEVEGKQNTSTRIGLEAGEIFMNVTEQGRDNFEVATNTTVASVKGTDFGAESNNYFWVEEGEVEVSVSETGETVTLTDSQFGQVQDDGSIETGELTEDELDERSQEYEDMEENVEPEILEVRFIDEDGQEQVIEIKVFENEN
jgi:hypothetical protein